jgi:hypothetical protein
LKIDRDLAKYTVTKITQRHPLNPVAAKRMYGDDQLARIFAVYYSAGTDPSELAEEIYSQNKDVLDWAEPDYVMVSDFTPNDPSIGSQYHISKIASYAAWDITQGDTNVVIGLVDTGSDLDHPDLSANTITSRTRPIQQMTTTTDTLTTGEDGTSRARITSRCPRITILT